MLLLNFYHKLKSCFKQIVKINFSFGRSSILSSFFIEPFQTEYKNRIFVRYPEVTCIFDYFV